MDGGSPGGKETSIKKEEFMIEKLFTYIYIGIEKEQKQEERKDDT